MAVRETSAAGLSINPALTPSPIGTGKLVKALQLVSDPKTFLEPIQSELMTKVLESDQTSPEFHLLYCLSVVGFVLGRRGFARIVCLPVFSASSLKIPRGSRNITS